MTAIERTLEARLRFQEIDEELDRCVAALEYVAAQLKRQRSMCGFFQSGQDRGSNALVFESLAEEPGRAREWPSAEKIQRLLSQWHLHKGEVDRLWRAMPEEDRARLPAPDAAERAAGWLRRVAGNGRGR
ncbi:MAG: hypothetical protein MI723_00990 [Caulobacterales bacterium]|nr:hypothetical protein [Caulobacterales bacterium]